MACGSSQARDQTHITAVTFLCLACKRHPMFSIFLFLETLWHFGRAHPLVDFREKEFRGKIFFLRVCLSEISLIGLPT